MSQMKIDEYLSLMQFPEEWKQWEMLPDTAYLESLIRSYRKGMEEASEHDRNGVFHWWLRQEPSEERLLKLAKLTLLDPDQGMANDVRHYIRRAGNYSDAIAAVLNSAT